ncbi:MAG: sigma-70 family RNA polymerase sigma factor [Pseudomonadota bacterium]
MAELLDKIAQHRDKEAFRELFVQYGPKVKGLLISQGTDVETAEELAQETLLTVWKKAHLFSSQKGSASTWIFTIARNLRIDRLRSEKIWGKMVYEIVDQASDEKKQDEIIEEQQRKKKLLDAMQHISEDQYAILELSYIKGLSHSEISEKLDLPLGTVKSRMRLAYGKIKERLKDDL